MKPVRLIATDLDGTLLRSDGTISARTAQTLRAARGRGLRVVAVTARPPRTVTQLGPLAELVDGAICVNGALLIEAPSARVVDSSPIPVPIVRAAATMLREVVGEVNFAVETGWEVMAEQGWRYHADRHAATPGLEEVLGVDDPVLKLLAHCPGRDVNELLTVARAAGLPDVEVCHSGGPGLLEISAAGVTKAGALARYCAANGIASDEVVAFGDMPNDAPMLQWAGRSFAMAGAHPEAVAAATDRTGANDEDGVAMVVEGL